MKMNKIIQTAGLFLCAFMLIFLAQTEKAAADLIWPIPTAEELELPAVDYKVLVNKENPLPEDWKEKMRSTHMINSLGDDVEVEAKAYTAYQKLIEDLAEEGISVDLISACRDVVPQQELVEDLTEKYGEEYGKELTAMPDVSEHSTGLALDLFLIIDGKEIIPDEDGQYPEIWAKVHEKLPEYGFILRYPEGKEDITGYGYIPWHIRYIDDTAAAGEIAEKGLTLEEYLQE